MTENIENTLRGQPFIAKKDEGGHLRECQNCFYGVKEADNSSGIEYAGKCLTSGTSTLFSEKEVPAELDGKKVGNFCPDFADYCLYLLTFSPEVHTQVFPSPISQHYYYVALIHFTGDLDCLVDYGS